MPLIPVLLGGTTTEGESWSLCWDDCWVDGVWAEVSSWDDCWENGWVDCWGGAGSMVYPASGAATAITSAHFENATKIAGNSIAYATASLGSGSHTYISGEMTALATASFDTTQTIFVTGEATGGGYARLYLLGEGWADCWRLTGTVTDTWGLRTWGTVGWGSYSWGLNTWADRDRPLGSWTNCWVASGGLNIEIASDQTLEVAWIRHEYDVPEAMVRRDHEVGSIRRDYTGE